MLFVYNCYIILVISLLLKVDCFRGYTARTCKYSVLWSKGFGNNDNKGKNNDDNENNSQKKDKDMLAQIIAEKEAEFQAELDQLLKESRDNRGANNEADDPFEKFSNEDLAKAIIEMQKLQGSGKQPEFNESDYQLHRFTVPNGYSGGDTITIEWKGAYFEIDIPEGCTEGDEVEIELPSQA